MNEKVYWSNSQRQKQVHHLFSKKNIYLFVTWLQLANEPCLTLLTQRNLKSLYNEWIIMYFLCLFQLGELGKGAGKGGGGGGSVREAGGAFGKREVAEEERYFRWEAPIELVIALLSAHVCILWFSARFQPSFCSLCFRMQAEGEGADGGAEEASYWGDWAPQKRDWAPTERDWPS